MTMTAPGLSSIAQPSAYDTLAEPPGLTITASPTFASKAASSFLKPCPWLRDTSPLTGAIVAAEAADPASNKHAIHSATGNPRMVPVPTVTIHCALRRGSILLQPTATNQSYKASAPGLCMQTSG